MRRESRRVYTWQPIEFAVPNYIYMFVAECMCNFMFASSQQTLHPRVTPRALSKRTEVVLERTRMMCVRRREDRHVWTIYPFDVLVRVRKEEITLVVR